jgi:hypothetical protein
MQNPDVGHTMKRTKWFLLVILGWPLLKILYYFATRFEVDAPLQELDFIFFGLGVFLALCMWGTVRATRRRKSLGSFGLSWKRFAPVAILLLAMPLLFLYISSRSGGIDATSVSIPLLCLSSLAFSGFRWSRMRRDFASGKFTEADFRSNPLPILVGQPKQAMLWFCATLLLVFLPIAWWAYAHWPKA